MLKCASIQGGLLPRNDDCDKLVTNSRPPIALPFDEAYGVRYRGSTSVFVDIDPANYNIDPNLIKPAVTPRTHAILCVDQMGMPCDLPEILRAGRRRGFPVIEDAACAIGSEIRWEGR